MKTIQNNGKFVVEGTVKEAFPGAKFRIELDNDHEIIGYASGKMRRHNIRVLLGDQVKVELSPYDMERGRIIYRYKQKQEPERSYQHAFT